MIARLEADGHVVVHRGGGRAGATNSHTVVTDIHSPGQDVTPDTQSGGDTGDMPHKLSQGPVLRPTAPGDGQAVRGERRGDLLGA